MHTTRKFLCPPLLDIAFRFFASPTVLLWSSSNISRFSDVIASKARLDMTNKRHIQLRGAYELSSFRKENVSKCLLQASLRGAFLTISWPKEESSHDPLNWICPSFCHISSCFRCNDVWKKGNIWSWSQLSKIFTNGQTNRLCYRVRADLSFILSLTFPRFYFYWAYLEMICGSKTEYSICHIKSMKFSYDINASQTIYHEEDAQSWLKLHFENCKLNSVNFIEKMRFFSKSSIFKIENINFIVWNDNNFITDRSETYF